MESGLIDFPEDSDIVLATKGYPDIQGTISDSGEKVMLVMPLFIEERT